MSLKGASYLLSYKLIWKAKAPDERRQGKGIRGCFRLFFGSRTRIAWILDDIRCIIELTIVILWLKLVYKILLRFIPIIKEEKYRQCYFVQKWKTNDVLVQPILNSWNSETQEKSYLSKFKWLTYTFFIWKKHCYRYYWKIKKQPLF